MNENPIVYSATLSTITRIYNASLAVSSRTYSANVATVINATVIDVPEYEGSHVATPTATYVNGALVTGSATVPTIAQDSSTKVLTIS